MLDEKRIRQMTKLAFFEKKEEKNALRIGRYFRSDYIGKELLKNFFLASIGYILVLAVAVLYHIEWLVDEIDTIDLQFAAGCLIASYLCFLAVYSIAVYVISTIRYQGAQKKLKWAADFEFALFPYLVNGIKNHLEDAYFRDMSGCELAEIEQAAGEKCQPIGHIGYYYPAEVWISEYGKLYAKYEYQDEIECFPDVFALIERDLRQCKFDSAAMKTVEALDGKL